MSGVPRVVTPLSPFSSLNGVDYRNGKEQQRAHDARSRMPDADYEVIDGEVKQITLTPPVDAK